MSVSKFDASSEAGSSKKNVGRKTQEASSDSMVKFLAMCQSCSVNKVYERRGGMNMCKHTFNELFSPAKEAFLQAPASRPAVMHFMAILAHEGVCIHIYNLENPRNAMDGTSIDQTLSQFVSLLKQAVVADSTYWCPTVFKWCVDVLADVSQRNQNRPQVNGKPLADVIHLMANTCPTTSRICHLMSSCITVLMDDNSSEVTSKLIDTRAHGPCFDWIFSYIGASFPSTIIGLLIKDGVEKFASHMDEMTPGRYAANRTPTQAQALRDVYQTKLRSLGDILSQMAQQRSRELKEEIKNIVKEGGSASANIEAYVKVAFLFFLSSISKDILLMTLNDAVQLITHRSVIKIASGLNKLPLQNILGTQQLPDIILQMCLTPDQKYVTKIFDLLRTLAFTEPPGGIKDIDSSLYESLRYHANRILAVFLGNISRQVHGQPNFRHSDLPLLNRVDEDIVDYIYDLKSEDEKKKCYSFRLLVYLALAKGQEKACEVMSLVLFSAKQEGDIVQFVSLNRVLRPFYPQLLNQLVERFETYKCLAIKAIKLREQTGVDLEKQWVKCLLWLVQFQVSNAPALNAAQQPHVMLIDEPKLFFDVIQPIQYTYGRFVLPLLSLCSIKDTKTMHNIFQLLKLVGRPVHLLPKYVMQIIHGILDIYFEILEIVDTDAGKVLLKECSDYCIAFTMCQHDFAQHTFWKALMQNIFRHYSTLLSEPAPSKVKLDGNGVSLLDANMQTISSKPNQMIHSGSIRKIVKNKPGIQSPLLLTRNLAVVDFVDTCCQKEKGTNFYSGQEVQHNAAVVQYDLDSCRMLANNFTQLICEKDAIALLFHWEDWTAAKMTPAIEKYLSISKRVDEMKFGWDILFLIAEANPCLWFCSPILKSILASLLVQCQACANAEAPVSSNILCKLDKWFALVVSAQMLPKPLDYLYDVIGAVPNLEASVVLNAIWNYFKSVHPSVSFLRSHFEMCNLQLDQVPPLKGDVCACLEACRTVMQAHIAKVGYLYPTLYPSALE